MPDYIKQPAPFELYEIPLTDVSDDGLVEISNELGLALSLEEMQRIQSYFQSKGRNPSDIEIQAIAQNWSEHCCYKSSRPILEEFIFGINAPQNILVISEDAGVVEFDKNHAYVLALESHNHPSAIEPYGGAATGIGGILRDVVCMGAQPVALIDPLFFGPTELGYDEVPLGVKHPKYLLSRVVAGISDYGNRVGIPTVSGMVHFDKGYVGNCLVNVGCVGIARSEHIIRSAVKEAGDALILVGGRTGRDGIHGVTFASCELDSSSEEESIGSVQLGDPITKEPLIHACLEVNERGLLNGMKDLGGGGLSCVVTEMADSGGFGAQIVLDHVPLKEEGLLPWEIWVSESQERFMLAVSPSNVESVLEVFDKWDIEARLVGGVIPQRSLVIWYKDVMILDLDLDLLTKPPVYERECFIPEKSAEEESKDLILDEPEDYNPILLKLLASPNIRSRSSIIHLYDHEVRGATVLKPIEGRGRYETHQDASVIKPIEESFKGLVISSDVNPSFMQQDPFWGAASAIDEVCRNVTAVGGRIHSFADCLNFGNPEKPDRMGDFREACRGLGFMATELGVPFVSGNVSFYNETPDGSIPPTPVILGVGLIDDVRHAISSDLKEEGNALCLLGETKLELGGSAYLNMLGIDGGIIPRTDPDHLKTLMDQIIGGIESGVIVSCHDLSEGGIGVAISEMAIGSGIGATIDIKDMGSLRQDYLLFSESNSRWLVEIKRDDLDGFISKTGATTIGEVGGSDIVIRCGDRVLIELSLDEVISEWSKPLI
ncbi:MAG: phosphoribosylformylglycinamidine synthase II [Candidatus Syntrophoarchaeum sp. GoM_oil]|nr:MAG: phosphoribosylformylglycinamidine synthase II [Candidatus Syntrophoarchaeum sp. GoM_oil]